MNKLQGIATAILDAIVMGLRGSDVGYAKRPGEPSEFHIRLSNGRTIRVGPVVRADGKDGGDK